MQDKNFHCIRKRDKKKGKKGIVFLRMTTLTKSFPRSNKKHYLSINMRAIL